MLLNNTHNATARHFAFLLDKSDVVPNTELVLQVMPTSAANESSAGHDADPVAQVISLVHEVSGQQDDSVGLVAFEQLPNVSSG